MSQTHLNLFDNLWICLESIWSGGFGVVIDFFAWTVFALMFGCCRLDVFEYAADKKQVLRSSKHKPTSSLWCSAAAEQILWKPKDQHEILQLYPERPLVSMGCDRYDPPEWGCLKASNWMLSTKPLQWGIWYCSSTVSTLLALPRPWRVAWSLCKVYGFSICSLADKSFLLSLFFWSLEAQVVLLFLFNRFVEVNS